MSLEKVVRPAQTPDIAPPKTQPNYRSRSGWKPVVISWGGGEGQMKTMSGSYTVTINYYAIKRPKEESASSGSFLGITFP